jgi:hypothetical protein
MPIDQQSVTASTPSIKSGLPTRQKASSITRSVSPNARNVDTLLSLKAAVISSLDSAGPPVTPACTLGNDGLRSAITPRMISIA